VTPTRNAVTLLWIPLGAGGNGFVRNNGRIFERIAARRQKREPLALVHSALEVLSDGVRYTIENGWPSPDADTASRGVVLEGPVGAPWAARFRAFRYEVRRWRDGVIPDADEAIDAVALSTDGRVARDVLALTAEVPCLVWGRTPPGCPEMWNSNSVVAWILTRAGIQNADARLPAGTRAPGWQTGVEVARGTATNSNPS